MKLKVYLAKSNRSNPDDVFAVRSVLSKYNVEVIEFSGGKYSHSDLCECDMLVVVPDLTDISVLDNMEFPLGKGLHEQIEAFTNRGGDCGIFIVTSTLLSRTTNDVSYVHVSEFSDFEFSNEDDYVNYSLAVIGDEDYQLSEILEEELKNSNQNVYASDRDVISIYKKLDDSSKKSVSKLDSNKKFLLLASKK